MNTLDKLRLESFDRIVESYNPDPVSGVPIDLDIFALLRKVEIKLYNNVVRYLQEYPGDFKQLYCDIIDNLCELLENNQEIINSINTKTIDANVIRRIESLNIIPEFNPRQLCRDSISSTLKKDSRFSDIDTDLIAEKIERYCFEFVKEYCRNNELMCQLRWNDPIFLQKYEDRISIILNHLNPNTITNKTYGTIVLDKYLNGELNEYEIATLEDTQLCPLAIAAEKDEIDTRNSQGIKQKHSTMFKCPQCKARRCTYREVQIRGSDESADIFCKCLNCGNRFKGH
jgi:DNA-directed RNA polymerase subunit M/transcription elongation factor TFIIS